MADLLSGGYAQSNPLRALLGQLANTAQGNLAARSNIEWGIGNPSDGALAGTGVSAAVPIPVDYGQIITKVSILVGATAEGTGTHAFMALYSGIATPALMAQSADDTGAAAAAASAIYTRTLATAQLITPTNAPNGFIYASVCFTAGTVPTCLAVATPTAVGYQWTTNGPLFLSATHGSAQGATAAATITTPAAKAVAPVVILT